MGKRVLVVDDDPHLRDVVSYTLVRDGYEVEIAADGKAALALCLRPPGFDLVVLDVLMPEMDGLEVCRRLRATTSMPIVFLSSRDEEIDKVVGLELGGDDYVTKPFSPRELSARVRAVLRRVEARESPVAGDEVLVRGPITLDPTRHEVSCRGEPVKLTVTEFGLLASLMQRPGHVLTRQQLVDQAYTYDNLITLRTIDTHVKRIRKKFGAIAPSDGAKLPAGHDPIETVHGLGYKLRE